MKFLNEYLERRIQMPRNLSPGDVVRGRRFLRETCLSLLEISIYLRCSVEQVIRINKENEEGAIRIYADYSKDAWRRGPAFVSKIQQGVENAENSTEN